MSAALLSALLFGKPGEAGPDGTRDPDADEPADVRARLFALPPLMRGRRTPLGQEHEAPERVGKTPHWGVLRPQWGGLAPQWGRILCPVGWRAYPTGW